MHTWALFSCSSLITLTAYNLANLPKAAEAGPEPEPDPTAKSSSESKFSLEALSREYPEHEAAIALPPLPDKPQLSKLDTTAGYNPSVYNATQYPAEEIDLVALLEQEDLSFPTPDQVVTYRADAVQALPDGVPLPPRPPSTNNSIAAGVAVLPEPATLPQPEAPIATPAFAPDNLLSPNAQVPTRPSGSPAQPTQQGLTEARPNLPDRPAFSLEAEPQPAPAEVTEVSEAAAGELFAALPEATVKGTDLQTVPREEMQAAQPVENLMADQALGEFSGQVAASPDSETSMELTIARRQLINRYCDRARREARPAKRLAVCFDDTSEFAQRIPDAATAGTPMPGNVESPTRNNPEIGVLQSGNSPVSAAIAGP